MRKIRFLPALFPLLLTFGTLALPHSLPAQEVGYMGISIGMTREEVLKAAEGNELIHVPKNRDVDFFPIEEREILTLSVQPEIPHIYLQFFDNILYAMTVVFDERYVDYFTLCRRLEEKYGSYDRLTPQWRVWRLENVTVKVEKPAVVKYIALEEFLKATDFRRSRPLYNPERRETLLDGL
jgi:hypothetical protein